MMTFNVKILLWTTGFLALLLCFSIPCDQAIAQQTGTSDQGTAQQSGLSDRERQELEAYRKYVPALVKELDQAKSSQNAPQQPELQAYQNYLVKFYEQQAELQTIRTQMFAWQRSAGNWILLLIVVLTFGGLLMAGYQLYTATKVGQKMETTGFEASIHKVQITTSTVGLVVLIVSGVLLIAFQREVYPVIPEPTAAPQQSQH